VFDNQVMMPARHSTVAIAVGGRPAIAERGRVLEFLTILVAALEALIGAAAAFFSGSVALLSFSLDSVVEAASGAAVLWCLRADFDGRHRRHSERIALLIVGACFLLLAVYVAYESIAHLLMREVPGRSISGIVLAAVSMITMPLLARAKRRVARDIGSGAMHADATQSKFCAYLSAILLGGLVLNALWGWWWADPLASLGMVPIIANEGIQSLRGKNCCESCDYD
jgi:divalent metal cation (Fe/Co/Zn/Cd) transporter